MNKPSRLAVGAAGVALGAGVVLGGTALAEDGSSSPSPAPQAQQHCRADRDHDARAMDRMGRMDRMGGMGRMHWHHPGGRSMAGHGHRMLGEVAKAAGVSPRTLMLQVHQGRSLAQVAQAHGVGRAKLVSRLDADAHRLVTKLVDKKMTGHPMMPGGQ